MLSFAPARRRVLAVAAGLASITLLAGCAAEASGDVAAGDGT